MDPHSQSQNTGSFSNASTVKIGHGVFNDVRGNQYTTYNTYYISTDLPQRQDPRLCLPATRAITHNSIGANAPSSSSHVMEATDISSPGLFPMLENTLELITHLVDAAPTGSPTLFHRISPDLRDLVRLVAVSSTAYQACTSQTPIGRLIRGNIDNRLALCNSRLVALHREMLGLPYRSVPLVRSVCRALYQWWTANEPEEITLIRSQLNAETIAFGEWLSDLKSFYWASRLVLVAKGKFSWRDLDGLLNSGPDLLKEIHVDKIIIIEPLQGDQLSVPIRFVASFEDIHHIVQFACHGTVGARYIEGRQYQLDDAATNATVNPERFAEECLEDGKTFEVAMKLVQQDTMNCRACPRCGSQHSEEERVSGWIRCRFCKIQFNSHISEASESDLRVPGREATSSDAIGQETSPQGQVESQWWLYMMFRRLLIEIQPHRRSLDFSRLQVGSGALSSYSYSDDSPSSPGNVMDVRPQIIYDMPQPTLVPTGYPQPEFPQFPHTFMPQPRLPRDWTLLRSQPV
ncbi:hypothetical protein BKA70DRAFT_865182 [Coprinopsis sp. MPI-PUGE-AT-0042]|nr:hypothetical protein BKA70DRAFT_865182 [Coprinopsis sp. MPI-PUGE-AT-0042]